jgi:hypothetical protein
VLIRDSLPVRVDRPVTVARLSRAGHPAVAGSLGSATVSGVGGTSGDDRRERLRVEIDDSRQRFPQHGGPPEIEQPFGTVVHLDHAPGDGDDGNGAPQVVERVPVGRPARGGANREQVGVRESDVAAGSGDGQRGRRRVQLRDRTEFEQPDGRRRRRQRRAGD